MTEFVPFSKRTIPAPEHDRQSNHEKGMCAEVGGDGELGARGSLALAVVTGRPRTASASQIGGKRGDCSMGQSMPSGE